MSFKDLGLIESLLYALDKEGYTTPTPVQSKAIPIVLGGKDLLACAQTGTGKTAAFVLPILQHLVADGPSKDRKPRGLIVTPTRELAIQIDESIAAYGKKTNIRHTAIFGGVNQHKQVSRIQQGVDILVATPGRLLDLIQQGHIKLDVITHFVLDEADRMLDMGFVHDVKRIIKLLPQKRQSLFFSATMPDSIMALAGTILTSPETVEVTPVSSTVDIIEQRVYFVDQKNKTSLLQHIIETSVADATLVFTRTKHGADKVVKILNRSNLLAEAIHGNKSQNARQKALNQFKSGITKVLVATDIAARGIDIDELALVINFELPNIPETYVHRIGRTGRAGASGKAISFCDIEERPYLKDIQKLIGKEIPVIDEHPYPTTNQVVVETNPKPNGNRNGRNHGPSNNSKSGQPTERKHYFQGKGTTSTNKKSSFKAHGNR
ncbi:MAG: DEAD/DEAH box helicase [Saprospiraceae bacterium]